MSMLTPPGMGGKYRITGDKYPRMRPPRRRARLVAAVVASVAVLGLVGWGTLQLIDVFSGGKKSTASGTKTECRTKAAAAARVKDVPAPGGITVNVYNATARSGLAKKTADELKKRGFKIGDVGNAAKEFDKKIKGTGMLLGPVTAQDTSLPVLATQLADAERRTDAGRKGAALDLIIGDAFKELAKPAAAQQALTALTAPAASADRPKKAC
ncbi:LytR cell envelope-related transcriptional attenuator [Streptomyces sp. 1222.5]|uniref:LytR C-terminal domain-containing protein n=1 Tax=unclassified Streptomyces TaxID=2593676 RepID=UPI000897ED68|nr:MULTISPECIES: LytR C-terminal domain-containing protein [unclassified Streptomyces]PKW08694.1 LytR cell envelope-related transcriptional attenuator [Streptomyces sp. 5112.2]SEC56191.1 LytR cell envelope-related transcriptional attenuator [Streptomyces sp. 1222.5]